MAIPNKRIGTKQLRWFSGQLYICTKYGFCEKVMRMQSDRLPHRLEFLRLRFSIASFTNSPSAAFFQGSIGWPPSWSAASRMTRRSQRKTCAHAARRLSIALVGGHHFVVDESVCVLFASGHSDFRAFPIDRCITASLPPRFRPRARKHRPALRILPNTCFVFALMPQLRERAILIMAEKTS